MDTYPREIILILKKRVNLEFFFLPKIFFFFTTSTIRIINIQKNLSIQKYLITYAIFCKTLLDLNWWIFSFVHPNGRHEHICLPTMVGKLLHILPEFYFFFLTWFFFYFDFISKNLLNLLFFQKINYNNKCKFLWLTIP
jgi:hypothetical protein